MPNQRNGRLAAVLTSVAALAVVGGTLATLTDSDNTDAQVLKSGTIKVALVEGSTWNSDLANLGIGDTASRSVIVDNTSTLAIGSLRLSADIANYPGRFGGLISDAITVDIAQDASLLADDVRLADLANGYDLVLPADGLPAGADATLTFDYTVAGARTAETGDRTHGKRDASANPDNKYQGSSLSVTYTIDAVQRTGNGIATALVAQPDSAQAPLIAAKGAGSTLDQVIYDPQVAAGGVAYAKYTAPESQHLILQADEPGAVTLLTANLGAMPSQSTTAIPNGTAGLVESGKTYFIRMDASAAKRTLSITSPRTSLNDTMATATMLAAHAPGSNPASINFSTNGAVDFSDDKDVWTAVGKTPSIWYRYTPVVDQQVDVQLDKGVVIAGALDESGTVVRMGVAADRRASLLVRAGETAYFKVSRWNISDVGTMTLMFPTGPANDDIAKATPVPGDLSAAATFPVDTTGAAISAGEPVEVQTPAVWYRYTATETRGIDVTSSAGSSVVKVWEKTPEGLVSVFYLPGFQPLAVEAGKTYYVAIVAYNKSGTITFRNATT